METANKFSLTNYGIDTVLYEQMIGSLELDEQRMLNDALETVPAERSEFIAKVIKPYLRNYENAVLDGKEAMINKQRLLAKNALYHAIALTRLPADFPLMSLTVPQSETFLSRVISMAFFYPIGVDKAFHKDHKFADSVRGAGYRVIAGDRSLYRLNDLELRGRNARLLAEYVTHDDTPSLRAA